MSDGVTNLSPDVVQCEIARLIATPSTKWNTGSSETIFNEIELQKILLFRAFITKVMHNGIRKFVPSTLKALSVLGVELDFFSAISPSFQNLREKGPIPTEVHLNWFGKALEEWVQVTKTEVCALILEIYTHEMFANAAREAHAKPTKKERNPKTPWIEGELILNRYQFDVLRALHATANGALEPADLRYNHPVTYAYWLDSNENLKIMAVDILTALVLKLVDGKRTVDDISDEFAQIGYEMVDSRLLTKLLSNLARSSPLQFGT